MRLLTTPPIISRGWPTAAPVQRTATARVVPDRRPMAPFIPGAAITPVSRKSRSVDRASSLTAATVALSVVVHAAAVLAVLFLVSSRAVPSAVSSETAIALVFAPVRAAPPPSPEVGSPAPDGLTQAEPDQPELVHDQQTSAAPEPAASQPPLMMTAPTPTTSPDAESRPIVPAQAAQPIPEAPRRVAPTPPPKPAVIAHAA